MTSLVEHLCEEEGGPVDPAHLRENPYLVFLSACRVALLVAASQEVTMHLSDKNTKVKIIHNILTGITTLVSYLLFALCTLVLLSVYIFDCLRWESTFVGFHSKNN